ncbi:MAG: 30S ribosomal protein S3 [Ferrimicrobium sp.]
MGQKVHPYGFRLGVTTDWKSRWYAERDYKKWLVEDWRIRSWLMRELQSAAVSRVDIERTRDRIKVDIHTARPGIVIGKKGAEVDRLRQALEAMTHYPRVQLNVEEIRRPELDAALVAQSIADQIARRVSFRRAMKRSIQVVMKEGGKGVTVQCSGRLGGAEMARRETHREGRVPRHTLRADIDYGIREAHTTYGAIGVKVWIYKGDVVPYAVVSSANLPRPRAGETPGQPRPRRVITAGGGRRKAVEETAEVESPVLVDSSLELGAPVNSDLERLLADEEDIERRTKDDVHAAPHFKKEVD